MKILGTKILNKREVRCSKMILFLFLTAFSNAEGFPSEPEENGLFSRDMQDSLAKSFGSIKILSELIMMKEQKKVVKEMEENLSPVINCEHKDSVEIQRELKEQKTVAKERMLNIQAEMTEMKECLLRSKENIAESISACTAALEESIQDAIDWATPKKEDHVGISDPGESQD